MRTPDTGFRHCGARCSSPPRRAFRAIARVAATAALALLTGCNAMSSPQEAGMELAVKIDTSKPIRFSTHSFGAHCYEATECRVVYFNRVIRSGDYPESAIPYPTNDLSERLIAPHIAIPNFQSPAEVSWKSMDGKHLEARVDIAEIFKDEVIRHQVSQDDLAPFLYAAIEPDIVLVVRDRTLEVFMRAEVPTRELQVPGNPYSNFRNDLILAYRRSY